MAMLKIFRRQNGTVCNQLGLKVIAKWPGITMIRRPLRTFKVLKVPTPTGEIRLLPEKAIFLREEQVLIVADLHFGKINHFRQAGLPVPKSANQKNAETLTTFVTLTSLQLSSGGSSERRSDGVLRGRPVQRRSRAESGHFALRAPKTIATQSREFGWSMPG